MVLNNIRIVTKEGEPTPTSTGFGTPTGHEDNSGRDWIEILKRNPKNRREAKQLVRFFSKCYIHAIQSPYRKALERDGYRCVVSNIYESSKITKDTNYERQAIAESGENFLLLGFTRCAYIMNQAIKDFAAVNQGDDARLKSFIKSCTN
jgi:hypothetical protein